MEIIASLFTILLIFPGVLGEQVARFVHSYKIQLEKLNVRELEIRELLKE